MFKQKETKDYQQGWNSVVILNYHMSGMRFDVWAKHWDSEKDKFEYVRFTDCLYTSNHRNERKSAWENVSPGWFVTHWRFSPVSPEDEALLFETKKEVLSKEVEEYSIKNAYEYIKLNIEDNGVTLNNLAQMLGYEPIDNLAADEAADRGPAHNDKL